MPARLLTPNTVLILLTLIAAGVSAEMETPECEIPSWELIWSDEFDSPEINPENWTHEIGGHGWGNRELQYYSDDPKNSFIEGGTLFIQALKDDDSGKRYSSARLTTRDKFEFRYGRIEARIRIPHGKGMWPAFWMLGADFPELGWPLAGEIDIMENIGSEPMQIHGTVHGPGYSKTDGVGTSYRLPGGRRYADDFHIFSLEWEAHEIRWYVNGVNYLRLSPEDIPGEWVFNRPFYLIMNVAVGGKWPGKPGRKTPFPQSMMVDYVRVYQKSLKPRQKPLSKAGDMTNGTTATLTNTGDAAAICTQSRSPMR